MFEIVEVMESMKWPAGKCSLIDIQNEQKKVGGLEAFLLGSFGDISSDGSGQPRAHGVRRV